MQIVTYKGEQYAVKWSNKAATCLVRPDNTSFTIATSYLDIIPKPTVERDKIDIISDGTGALKLIGHRDVTIPDYLNACAAAVRKGFCGLSVAPTTVQRSKQYRCELHSINGTRLDSECHLPAGKCFHFETWQAIVESVRNPTKRDELPANDFFS